MKRIPLIAAALSFPSICVANTVAIGLQPEITTPPAKGTTYVDHAYRTEVDNTALVPRWVMYTLKGEVVIGCNKRRGNFHEEEQIAAMHRASPVDYDHSGYDKGHMAPAEDFALDPAEMSDSFSMANMAPQLPGLNRAEWEHLEETVRAWAFARGELTIFVGPVIPDHPKTIGADHVAVPSAFWKVIWDRNKSEALAFMMPQRAIAKGDLKPWETTIADIEKAAGVELPVENIDPTAKPALWPSSITGYRKEHKAACGG